MLVELFAPKKLKQRSEMLKYVIFAALFVGKSSFAVISPLNRIHPELDLLKNWKNTLRVWSNQTYVEEVKKLLELAHTTLRYNNDADTKMNLSDECSEAVMQFGVDFTRKKTYTLKVDDADGKPESGIFRGNIRWNGRYFQCLQTQKDRFKGKWCELDIGGRMPILNEPTSIGMSMGMCIPDVCSADSLNKELSHLVNGSDIPLTIRCPKQPTEWTTVDIISCTLFCIVATLAVLATVLEKLTMTDNTDDTSLAYGNGLYFIKLKENPKWIRVITSFSIIKNTKKLMDSETKPDTIKALHGIRFLSIAWVVLGHSFLMPMLYVENFLDAADWYTKAMSFQIVSGAVFAVDTFFFIGGLLVIHLGMKAKERKLRPITIAKMYFMRFIRLTPPYAAIIFLIVGFYGKLGDGPMWPDAVEGEENSVPAVLVDEFALHQQSLPNFINIPGKRAKIGLYVLLFGVFCNALVTGLLSAHYHDVPLQVIVSQLIGDVNKVIGSNITDVGPNDNSHHASDTNTIFADLYMKPWCRIGPYLIGMITGYIIHYTGGKVKMSRLFVGIFWLIAFFLSASITFGLWPYIVAGGSDMPNSLAGFYNALCRITWSLALGWVVIACKTGYGGSINSFLSWNFFIPLSRLSYSIYLVHPLVILWWHATQEVTGYYSNKQFGFYYVGTLGISVAFAYVLSMLFEVPAINLLKLCKTTRDSEVTSSIVSRSSQIDDIDDDGEGPSGFRTGDAAFAYQTMEDDAFSPSDS